MVTGFRSEALISPWSFVIVACPSLPAPDTSAYQIPCRQNIGAGRRFPASTDARRRQPWGRGLTTPIPGRRMGEVIS
jgi:hypothetical protein